MINGTISILILLISLSLMVMSLGEPVYISACSDFCFRNETLTANLLKQGCHYHKFLHGVSKVLSSTLLVMVKP